MKALLKSYGEVVGKAVLLVPNIELSSDENNVKTITFQDHCTSHKLCEAKFSFPSARHIAPLSTHVIELAFESVVVEIIGEALQLAMLVEINSGVVSESIVDLAVVKRPCAD